MGLPLHKVVSVAFPIAVPGIYDYEVPDRLMGRVSPGIPVLVELKNRRLWGVAVRMKENSVFPELKPVLDIKSDRWTDADRSLIQLYEWIARYYQTDLGKIFRPFIKKGLANASAKTIARYQLSGNVLPRSMTPRQAMACEKLREAAVPLTAVLLREKYGVSAHMIGALCAQGVLRKEETIVLREAPELRYGASYAVYGLTEEQKTAVDEMSAQLESPFRPCLLYGITGSGKTFVYIELVKKALAMGKGALILVPEISLTPQTIQRFRQALGPVITVIHSRMADGERRDSLEELVTGRKRVVIGVRSAILAPMDRLGLIIVDEEHDASYKQSDMDPRYHARDVAVMRGHLQKALVVLGSATPSFESYRNALSGKYQLIPLTRRFGAAALPRVEIVDMAGEHNENNWTFLSRYLHRRISEVLIDKRQVILLLNRRGFSTVLICKDCGHTYVCPQCSVNLTYHKSDHRLKCHQCGLVEPAPQMCLKCRGGHIKYKGTGIQKAEEYLKAEFPQGRLLRMDQDTTRGRGAHIRILEKFANQEADILLGTQMVAKGLNFPGVALVGVLQADIGLHFPDFRAAEKTFQLLAQVAGRAGREDSGGEVIIQTYVPDDGGIIAAKDHDFVGFYYKEITARESLGYPPFGKLIRIIIQGEHEALVRSFIEGLARRIGSGLASGGITVLGPSPAVFSRIKNNYRYCMLLKSKSMKRLQDVIGTLRTSLDKPPKGIRMIIDVDPVNML
jgi:primosomal protein N' (replication factor Y) (superfamily II helicase)